MLKASTLPNVLDKDADKKHVVLRSAGKKRAKSISPTPARTKSPAFGKKVTERRCHSLSPSVAQSKGSISPGTLSAFEDLNYNSPNHDEERQKGSAHYCREEKISILKYRPVSDKDLALPHCLVTKLVRLLATKKRELSKLCKTVTTQQNMLLEQYAAVKDLEARVGVPKDNSTCEVRILSVTGWPAHDLLLLVRDDLDMPLNLEISGILGPQILQQLHAQLNSIPEEVLGMGAEIMARRIDVLNLLKGKFRTDRTYLTNLEWKTKNMEFDQDTEKLHRQVVGLVENLKAKLNYSLNLAKVSWLDRETILRKVDKLQRENMVLQNKMDELVKKEQEDGKEIQQHLENSPKFQAISEELAKEKAAREALKDVVSSAESMLRVARARMATLERQLKETKAELEASKKKQKDLEQLPKLRKSVAQYRHRETSYDARSKKLLEVSKTGEITIETLSRQRDALELRVKELREQVEIAEKQVAASQVEQKTRIDSLQAKVADQEKNKKIAEARIVELEAKVKEVEEQYVALRERSVRLVDTERRRCLEYVPSKENEPSDRETEIWKELQVTRVAMSRAEEELRQCRADKDSFLNSLNRIAQGEDADSFKDRMVMELLEKEQKIAKLQHIIEEHRDNEKLMEQSMTQYENQLAALRLDVKRLRNYDCYSKEIPYQELQTELLELHMQVETLTRERTALITAAASRALMLERHERSAELFARMTRARRDLSALIDGRTEPPQIDEIAHAEVSRSLSSVCASAADTWTALRAERARVLRLESAVLAQNFQLEREGRVRTQLERRRAMLERELLRVQHSAPQVESICLRK